LLVLGVSAAVPGSAEAQSFTYSAWTGTTSIPWALDSDHEFFPWDVFELWSDNVGSAPDTPRRYAPNINYRIRVIGNPYVRDVGLTFAGVNTVDHLPTEPQDAVRLGWYDGTGATLVRDGMWSAHNASMGASGVNSAASMAWSCRRRSMRAPASCA
jgi:hypothetical protein